MTDDQHQRGGEDIHGNKSTRGHDSLRPLNYSSVLF
jgi:hypothetical protein